MGALYLSTSHGIYSMSEDARLDVVLKAGEHDLFGGIAFDPDGTPHLVTRLSGVDGKAESVVATASDGAPQPVYDTTAEDPEDIAFTVGGVMFVSAGSEIHRLSPNGDIEVVHRGEHGPVTQFVTVALVVLVGGGIVLARVRANRRSAPQAAESSGWGHPHAAGSTVDYNSRPASRAAAISTGTTFRPGRGDHQVFALCPQWSQVGRFDLGVQARQLLMI